MSSEPFANYPSLARKVVLVTGGASGIGAEIVRQFSRQGSRVAFLDFDSLNGVTVAQATGAMFVQCDLRDVQALRSAVGTIIRQLGAVEVLVNNAARDDRHALEEVEADFWDERFATNLRHMFFCAQAVIPGMRAARAGSIVNLGSISWMLSQGGMPAYTSAKSAVRGLTRGLARDLGADGIRVNEVVPGWVFTERQIALWATPDAEAAHMVRQCIKERVMPPDIARMVLWLSADDSRMITAQHFVVDGGGS